MLGIRMMAFISLTARTRCRNHRGWGLWNRDLKDVGCARWFSCLLGWIQTYLGGLEQRVAKPYGVLSLEWSQTKLKTLHTMFGTLWAHSINTLLCWVHMERQILWRGCTNARWVNVFSAPDVHLLRLALKCQANWWCCVNNYWIFGRQKADYALCFTSTDSFLLDGQFWLYTVHPLYGEAWCNPVLSLWSVTKLTSTKEKVAILSPLLEAGSQRWTYDIHCVLTLSANLI